MSRHYNVAKACQASHQQAITGTGRLGFVAQCDLYETFARTC
jgi:hypothetical protein